jgi:choline dehydrogenase-like flavoprotein
MAPQVTIDEFSRRESAATAFLEPARDRANLHVSPNSQVTRILVDDVDRRATGVEYFDIRRNLRSIRARREVIVSAGAVNTPKILMLSGIGPAAELTRHGVSDAI